MTVIEMCAKFKKGMDSYIELIFTKLTKKGLDSNAFILEPVRKGLESLCFNCNPSKIA